MSEPETLFVEDTNCSPRYPTRMHEILIDGHPQEIEFQYRKQTELSYALAMKFTVDKAFRVTDADGKVYEPVKKARDTSVPLTLAPNEIVVELGELTQDALLRRAAIKPGGEKLSKSTKKDDIIAFLEAVYAAERNPGFDGDAPESDAIMDAMSPDEINAMFEDAA